MRVPAFALRQQVSVETYLGETGAGPSYAAPLTLRCRIEPKRAKVTNRHGAEVISNAVLVAFPEAQPHLLPESRVSWAGSVHTIVAALPAPDLQGRTAFVQAWLV